MATRYIDFDGTLAFFDHWQGPDHAGRPIAAMVERVKNYLKQGDEIVIFTARMTPSDKYCTTDIIKTRQLIEKWCLDVFGQVFEVTNIKGDACDTFFDDRAFRVVKNTGLTTEEFVATLVQQELTSGSSKEEALHSILRCLDLIQNEEPND